MANLQSYPAPPGNKPIVIANVTGPSSYTQVSNGTPPTGGQSLKASDYGLSAIEYGDGGLSDNGQYAVQVIIPGNPIQSPVQTAILRWTVAATGAEVSGATNLSGRTARVLLWST